MTTLTRSLFAEYVALLATDASTAREVGPLLDAELRKHREDSVHDVSRPRVIWARRGDHDEVSRTALVTVRVVASDTCDLWTVAGQVRQLLGERIVVNEHEEGSDVVADISFTVDARDPFDEVA